MTRDVPTNKERLLGAKCFTDGSEILCKPDRLVVLGVQRPSTSTMSPHLIAHEMEVLEKAGIRELAIPGKRRARESVDEDESPF